MNVPQIRLTSLAHGGGCGCKLAPSMLQQLLSSAPAPNSYKQLLVGIETGDDAAVWQVDDETCVVATTDFFMPMVDDPHDFGRIAATNALSDIYAMGGRPIFALALVGMPIQKLSTETIGAILEGGASVCREAGIPIAGGHSIDAAEPIYGLVAIGLVSPDQVRRNADARSGDCLVLGKPIGVGVLSAALKRGLLDEAGYARMRAPMTQLNAVGTTLAALPAVHAMTDVTGFGLLGHLLEVCRGSGLDATLDLAAVPVLDDARRFAQDGVFTGASTRNWASYGTEVALPADLPEAQRALLTDPQTSGGLLVSCAPEALDAVLATFRAAGFAEAACVGRMQARGDGAARVQVKG